MHLKENDEIVVSYKKLKNDNHRSTNDDYNKQTTRRDLVTSKGIEDNYKPSIEINDSKKKIKGLKAIIISIIIYLS